MVAGVSVWENTSGASAGGRAEFPRVLPDVGWSRLYNEERIAAELPRGTQPVYDTFNQGKFYQMLAVMDSTVKSELRLNSRGEPNLFMTPLTRVSFIRRGRSRLYNEEWTTAELPRGTQPVYDTFNQGKFYQMWT